MRNGEASTVRVEDLLGRRVFAKNGRVIGRIEEIRAERRGHDHEVTEFLFGAGALIERLAFARWLPGRRSTTYAARWDQIDVSDPTHPRLICGLDEIRTEHPHE